MYPMQKFYGLENEHLLVHLCCPSAASGQTAIEFLAVGGAVLTKEKFDEMVRWVNQEFERLSRQARIVH